MTKLVVMGVAGSGKSTLGAALARALDCRFIEGDDHHDPQSRAKMRQGIPLDDRERGSWLDRLARLLQAQPGDAVLACSALKRAHRDRLRARAANLRFVFLQLDRNVAAQRVSARSGHFFPVNLIDSQFAALEPPHGEPGVLAVPAALPLPEQLSLVLGWLQRGDASGAA